MQRIVGKKRLPQVTAPSQGALSEERVLKKERTADSPSRPGTNLTSSRSLEETPEAVVSGTAPEDLLSSLEETPKAAAPAAEGLPSSLEETPTKTKKPKEKRVQVKMAMPMVGIRGIIMGHGEMVVVKRNPFDSKGIAVYDAGLGGHVGWLPDDLSPVLSPWLASNPKVRIRGCILGPTTSAVSGQSSASIEPETPVANAATEPTMVQADDLMEASCTRMEIVLTGPISLEAEMQALRDRILMQMTSCGSEANSSSPLDIS